MWCSLLAVPEGRLGGGPPHGVDAIARPCGFSRRSTSVAHVGIDRTAEAITTGCDRAIPNELRRLWPRLSDVRHLLLNHRHGLSSQVPLMDVLPDATEPNHPEVQDDLSACDRP